MHSLLVQTQPLAIPVTGPGTFSLPVRVELILKTSPLKVWWELEYHPGEPRLHPERGFHRDLD